MDYEDFVPWMSAGNVAKFARDKTLEWIVSGKLTFYERCIVQRVDIRSADGRTRQRSHRGEIL